MGVSRSGFNFFIGVSMSFCMFFTWSEQVPNVLHSCTEGVLTSSMAFLFIYYSLRPYLIDSEEVLSNLTGLPLRFN